MSRNYLKQIKIIIPALLGLALMVYYAIKLFSVEDKKGCIEKGSYWYKEKCWEDYEDEGISKENIDETVQEQMKKIQDAKLVIDGQTFKINEVLPNKEEGKMLFFVLFDNRTKTLLVIIEENQLKKKKDYVRVLLFKGNPTLPDISDAEIEKSVIANGEILLTVHDPEDLDLLFSGNLTSESNNQKFSLQMSINDALIGAGNSTFEIKGDEAYLNGELGTKTYAQLKEIIRNHANVKTLVLGRIDGSVNDAVNMHTGRLVRENGFTTKVESNSKIASGGVDLFCAGKKRVVEKGAKIGIHSWCCVGEKTAIEISKDHPAHQYQLAYFTMCFGEDLGPKFYFHTLESAPFDEVYWMTDQEIKDWKVATKFIE